jgi:hypothetical protein
MSGIPQFLRKWGGLIAATLAIAAVPAALLTQLAASDAPTPPPVLRWIVAWLLFTLLIASVLAAGIVRMSWDNDGGENDMPPWRALAMLVAVIAVCLLSIVPIFGFRMSNVQNLLYGVLALAVGLALFMLWVWRRGKRNPPDNTST